MTTDLRWRNYVLGNDTVAMWRTLFNEKKRDVLYVLGLGFDERMCLGIEAVFAAGGEGRRDVCLLTFDEGPESASRAHGDLRAANATRIEAVVAADGRTCRRRNIRLVSDEGRPIGGRSITREFEGPAEFSAYTDVVVDVSALPRGLYFPLLAKLLSVFDQVKTDGVVRNLHVIVAHSPVLDSAIQDEGIDEATFLHGFSAAEFEREATREQPRVWIPVLGRGQLVQLDRILELVKPDEICPVLPSPAQNPREADDLMLEYRELLFDQLRVEPRNIIYASEANPFEVYRQIVRSVRHYRRALAPLSGCKAVVSAMSSKLSSIGALLAAYELRSGSADDRVDVGVAHVEARGYALNRPAEVPDPTLHSLWLAGECHGE
ncbi:MAG: hypothetical protein ACT4PU_03350 [Planctomycetota bacterium]